MRIVSCDGDNEPLFSFKSSSFLAPFSKMFPHGFYISFLLSMIMQTAEKGSGDGEGEEIGWPQRIRRAFIRKICAGVSISMPHITGMLKGGAYG
jgi:hypothetical protein